MKKHLQIATIVILAALVAGLFCAGQPLASTTFTSNPEIRNAPNSWAESASMPTNRSHFGIAAVNGIVYAMGGILEYNNGSQLVSQITNITDAFNPQTKAWSEKTPMPFPTEDFGIAACNGKIYVFGGYVYSANDQTGTMPTPVNFTEVYDPATDAWRQQAPLPLPMSGLFANAVNGKIYILGGEIIQEVPKVNPSDPQEITMYANNQTFVYDPAADSWTTKAPLLGTPLLGAYAISAVVGSKIYVIPENNGWGGPIQSNLTQIYDTSTNKWSNGSPIPVSLQGPAACATSGVYAPQAIYVFGGVASTFHGGFGMNQSESAWMTSMVEVYFPLNDSWGLGASMPTTRLGVGVVNVNDTFYVVGGETISLAANGSINFVAAQGITEVYMPYSFQDIKPPSVLPTLLLYGSVGTAIACLSGAAIFLVVKRRSTLHLWAAKSAKAMRALSSSAKWLLLCVFFAWAAFFVNGFLSATSLHWKIPLTSFLAIDVYGAIIPTIAAAFFVVFCLTYLKFSVRRYLVFLLFAIVLAISLTQVVRVSLGSASVTSPILLICGVDGIVGFIFAFVNSHDPLAAGAGFVQRMQFGWKQFAAALLATSSCAALSALFVDLVIARYLSIYNSGPMSMAYVGGAGSADGILAYLVLTLFVAAAIVTAVLAISTAIRSDKGQTQ